MHNPLEFEMIGMCTVVLDAVEDGMTVGGAPAAGQGMVVCALASYHSWERRNNKAPKSFMIILFVCLLACNFFGWRTALCLLCKTTSPTIERASVRERKNGRR